MHSGIKSVCVPLALALAACATAPNAPAAPNIVNDVSQMNPILVERVATPQSIEELSALVAGHAGPISIGGGRFSQGGQTACTGCLFIDVRGMNRILALNEADKTITVQAGATWREIQEALDPHDLSPAIMQSFAIFTVGGSLGVNCHGDYVGAGPLIESVHSIRIVLADGSIVTASRSEHRDLFDAAIGGYGGLGVIAEATLDVAPNQRLERAVTHMRAADYPAWHQAHVLGHPEVILEHGVIYPTAYRDVTAYTATTTDKPLTIHDRLPRLGPPSALQRLLLDVVTFTPFGPYLHQHVYDPLTADRSAVVMRNYQAARDVYSLAHILNAHHANVLNIAIRHARADRESMLSWARTDAYAFVLYYEQGTSAEAQAGVDAWTKELAGAAIAQGGSFYMPYQIHATRAQFLAAYPRADEYFAVKRRVDPTYKFRNRLWEAYYTP